MTNMSMNAARNITTRSITARRANAPSPRHLRTKALTTESALPVGVAALLLLLISAFILTRDSLPIS